MELLQMFFYTAVGLAASILVIERVNKFGRDTASQLRLRKAQALNKRFREAFESAQPAVELWWEDHGRKEMSQDHNGLLDMMPEQIRVLAAAQHADSIKHAALQLAGGLVLKSGGKLSAGELIAVNKEIDELRQQLLDHGINMDGFESLFV